MSSITHQRVRPARRPAAMATVAAVLLTLGLINPVAAAPPNNPGSVSYTHLTLPTSDLV